MTELRIELSAELSADEARAVDLNAEHLGIPRELLMENAGRSIADVVSSRVDVRGRSVLVVAGAGNKGGDGFVAARHLSTRGAKVTVVLVSSEAEIATREARLNWEVLKNMDLTVEVHTLSSLGVEGLAKKVEEADVIIDALVGTGLSGALREPVKKVVEALNRGKGLKVAIDIPTGLNSDTGEVLGTAFKAQITVTMHKPKRGLKLAREWTGEVVVAEIGIPVEAEVYTGPGDVAAVIKPRRADTHKYDYGVVLVVGGSPLYAGAPALAGMAALKSGVGLVVVAAPSSSAPYIKSFSPDLIVHSIKGEWIDEGAARIIIEAGLLEKATVMALGPGLGFNDATVAGVKALLSEASERGLRTLIDADGLKALATLSSPLKALDYVLTPHRGEYRALMGEEAGRGLEEAIEAAKRLAKKYRATVVLKGHRSVITDGERVKVNRSGNPGMAVGGVGDVLSGLIAGFMAQGAPSFTACCAATYINGRAGDLAAAEKGYHFTASDLLEAVPRALRELEPWATGYAELSAPRRLPKQ
ncbi:MAG: NAD(P)H-hydrate dehydratase [Candidatus Nezhaarchaeota archaeon]|nr:NAD(P)H-hydrate dehydratase [Candidatus Nezhaarchaeota archaeon]